jgi:predicted outer membrane repeat protein
LYNGDTSALTISSTTLASNVADSNHDGDGEGGAIFTENSATLSLNNNTLRGNSARAGGALYSDDATLTLTGNLFELNKATGGVTGPAGIGSGVGGAIFNSVGSTLILTDGTFTTNSASDDGGAIQNYGTLGITGTEFLNNSAGTDTRSSDVDKGRGGAIYNDDGVVILTSVDFNGNTSFGDAGALYNQDAGFVSIVLSTFDGNTASGNGGALFNEDVGQVLIDRTTVSNNTATGSGGGFYNDSQLNSSPQSPASTQLVGNLTAAAGSLVLLDASQFPSRGFLARKSCWSRK